MTEKQHDPSVGSAMSPLPASHPMMVAWTAYKATSDYQNSKAWALHIAPMVQAGDPEGERRRRFEIMPFDQRERHVEGSLWAMFVAGWTARATLAKEIK